MSVKALDFCMYITHYSIVLKLNTIGYPYPYYTLCTYTFLYFSIPNNFSKILLLSGDLVVWL